MIKLCCLPKLRENLKSVTIEAGVTDAEEMEDGYLSAAYMWQRAVYELTDRVVSNEQKSMERNGVLMMMAIEQQREWVEPFKEERKGIFRLSKPMERKK